MQQQKKEYIHLTAHHHHHFLQDNLEQYLKKCGREAAIAEKLRREAEAEFGVEISPDYIRKF